MTNSVAAAKLHRIFPKWRNFLFSLVAWNFNTKLPEYFNYPSNSDNPRGKYQKTISKPKKTKRNYIDPKLNEKVITTKQNSVLSAFMRCVSDVRSAVVLYKIFPDFFWFCFGSM